MTENTKNLFEVLSVLGAIIAFSWGVFQYIQNEKRQSESRHIEARKPFLERQLQLYTQATQAASKIVITDHADEKSASVERFWELYWGELALVEDKQVEGSVKEFGEGLNNNMPQEELQQLALKLAHACRDSLATSWGVKDWKAPRHKLFVNRKRA